MPMLWWSPCPGGWWEKCSFYLEVSGKNIHLTPVVSKSAYLMQVIGEKNVHLVHVVTKGECPLYASG